MLWETRRNAEQALEGSLRPYSELLDETFSCLDVAVNRLSMAEDVFGRLCAIVLIKARNLSLGCYSLMLDALAQEAGALLRPLLECLELLEYLRLDPARVNEALAGKLPKAGEIAQRIHGKFQGLRDYLNKHASHLSVSPDGMRHLIDRSTWQFRVVQPYDEAVLRKNLKDLLAVSVWVANEATLCTYVAEGREDQAIANGIAELNRRAFDLFDDVRFPADTFRPESSSADSSATPSPSPHPPPQPGSTNADS